MTKIQLFEQKNGQLAVGNRFAIYNTLAEAQVELRRWLRLEFGKNGNICYLDDKIATEGKADGIEYKGYNLPGWYECEGEGFYYDIYHNFIIDAADFTEFTYDMTKYFITIREMEDNE